MQTTLFGPADLSRHPSSTSCSRRLRGGPPAIWAWMYPCSGFRIPLEDCK